MSSQPGIIPFSTDQPSQTTVVQQSVVGGPAKVANILNVEIHYPLSVTLQGKPFRGRLVPSKE